ncbi:MAG: hypothetical protein WCG25_09595 [bacterium]
MPMLRGVVFDSMDQWTKFKNGIKSLLDRYAYNIQDTKPETFTVSKK